MNETELREIVRDLYDKHEAFCNDPASLRSRGPRSKSTDEFFAAEKELSRLSRSLVESSGPIADAVLRFVRADKAASVNAQRLLDIETDEESRACSARMETLEQAQLAMFASAGCDPVTTFDDVIQRHFPNMRRRSGSRKGSWLAEQQAPTAVAEHPRDLCLSGHWRHGCSGHHRRACCRCLAADLDDQDGNSH